LAVRSAGKAEAVSRNEIEVAAPPAAVFDTLMDPYAYADWVVGSKRVRAVDPEWPAVGARFHHTVGAPAVKLDDSTKLLTVEPERRVALEVRFRPVGIGVVTIELQPTAAGPGTRVVLTERPKEGPIRSWWARPLDWLTSARNAISLRRLRALCERRGTPTG
jgi:uncharacterized protein YndB with AHSA1/START domain